MNSHLSVQTPLWRVSPKFLSSFIAQQVSTLFAVKQIDQAKSIIKQWPTNRFQNPIVFSSLLSGLVDGGYYKEGIQFYEWCLRHSPASPAQSFFRSAVSVSSVIECFRKTQQPERAVQLFQQSEKAGIVMMKDVYFTIAKLCDTEKMWRSKYKEQLKDPAYRDHHK